MPDFLLVQNDPLLLPAPHIPNLWKSSPASDTYRLKTEEESWILSTTLLERPKNMGISLTVKAYSQICSQMPILKPHLQLWNDWSLFSFLFQSRAPNKIFSGFFNIKNHMSEIMLIFRNYNLLFHGCFTLAQHGPGPLLFWKSTMLNLN